MEIWSFWGGGGSLETLDLDLGEKVGNWSFLGWGSLETSDLDLGEKVGTLDWSFLGGELGFLGGSLETLDLDLGEKVGNLVIFGGGGVLWKLRIWT